MECFVSFKEFKQKKLYVAVIKTTDALIMRGRLKRIEFLKVFVWFVLENLKINSSLASVDYCCQ